MAEICFLNNEVVLPIFISCLNPQRKITFPSINNNANNSFIVHKYIAGGSFGKIFLLKNIDNTQSNFVLKISNHKDSDQISSKKILFNNDFNSEVYIGYYFNLINNDISVETKPYKLVIYDQPTYHYCFLVEKLKSPLIQYIMIAINHSNFSDAFLTKLNGVYKGFIQSREANNFIHNDFHIGNSMEGFDDNIKVIDFGISYIKINGNTIFNINEFNKIYKTDDNTSEEIIRYILRYDTKCHFDLSLFIFSLLQRLSSVAQGNVAKNFINGLVNIIEQQLKLSTCVGNYVRSKGNVSNKINHFLQEIDDDFYDDININLNTKVFSVWNILLWRKLSFIVACFK